MKEKTKKELTSFLRERYKAKEIVFTETINEKLLGGIRVEINDEIIDLTVKNKIKKYAFSGGQDTIEEHRKKGGNPDIDVSYQYLKMFFEPDDKKLQRIHDDYKSGKMLTSELKEILIEKLNAFLKEHQKKREQAEKQIDRFVLKD